MIKATYKTDSEYSYLCPLVHELLFRELVTVADKDDELVDLLTGLVCGSRQIRLAAMPNPESLVLIRSVIRQAIAEKQPIPVLVPSGPKKNSMTESVDLAELSALRILGCLNTRVRERFEPGLSIRVRLEDVTGIFLEGREANPIMGRYCSDFRKLVQVLGYSSFVTPLMESDIVPPEKLIDLAEEMYPKFFGVLTGQQGPEVLATLGWKAGVSEEGKQFLYGRYAKLYPELSEHGWMMLAARYMSMTLARTRLNASGGDPEWQRGGGRIDISFAPPSPSAFKVGSRVYYRTMPMSQTKLHVPFWRAKGFFKIDDGEVKTGLMPWPRTSKGFVEGALTMEDGDRRIVIKADIRDAGDVQP